MNPMDRVSRKNDEEVVPVIVPPLAMLLAQAEKLKGKPLTEAECERIRDEAPAIALPLSKAIEMKRSREFVDVEPENVWVDWHRLRCHMLGGYAPKLVLCVPLPERIAESSVRQAVGEGVEVEISSTPDPNVTSVFEWAGVPGVEAHGKVAYLVGPNYTQPTALENCISMTAAAARVVDLGGLALKCESSGVIHSAPDFCTLAEAIAKAPNNSYEQIWPLLLAYVLCVVEDEENYSSCGMHLLGFPDMVIAKSAAQEHFGGDVTKVSDLFRTFSAYLAAECPLGGFPSGGTFRTDDESPRVSAHWEPCTEYPEDDLYYNPYGMWVLS